MQCTYMCATCTVYIYMNLNCIYTDKYLCRQKVIHVFVFGDYKFLCRFFGNSGHSGKTIND